MLNPGFGGLREPRKLYTPGFEGFSVKFDPFNGQRLACASAADFGMKGPGRLWVFHGVASDTSPHLAKPQIFDTPEGLYDVAWSETNPKILVAAAADGSLLLYDISSKDSAAHGHRAVRQWREHGREVSCLDWNMVNKDRFLSSSYDGTIKIWREDEPRSLQTLGGHQGHVYQASWSPWEAPLLISVGADRSTRLWDERVGAHRGPFRVIEDSHSNEVLTVDWNKWDPMQFATGSVDSTICIWDWRMLGSPHFNVATPLKSLGASSRLHSPTHTLRGHQRAVRRLRWSPFSSTQLVSVGYDMAMRVWDVRSLNPLVGVWEGHSEFILGLDISLFQPEPAMLIATAGWDQSIHLLRPSHYHA